MKCNVCGTEYTEEQMFCSICGQRLMGEKDAQPANSAGSPTIALPASHLDDLPTISNDMPTMASDVRGVYSLPPVPPSPPYTPPSYTPPQSYAPPSYTPPSYTPPSYSMPTTVEVPNSTNAVVSLVFGILGWTVLPLIGPIVAVITGHMARNEIRRNPGRLRGDGLALAGLILGWIQVAIMIMLCGLLFLGLIVGAS